MSTETVVEALKTNAIVTATVTAQPQSNIKAISDRLKERFEILELLADACLKSKARSLIVSGPPGLGKSYTIHTMLEKHDPSGNSYSITKGNMSPVNLYKTLWDYRLKGNIIVLDDTDSVFNSEISIGLIKAVCDTTQKRVVSWKTEYRGLYSDNTGEPIPKSFEYEGAIIFLTNYDFDRMIQAENRLSPHLAAMMSRSHYVDLALKTRLDYLVRIIQVINSGMLDNLDKAARQEIMEYIWKNNSRLRELSLRTAIKLADLQEAHPTSWQRIANITCCKI
jgi:hypothetical protein